MTNRARAGFEIVQAKRPAMGLRSFSLELRRPARISPQTFSAGGRI
jgi:hypothetical protein